MAATQIKSLSARHLVISEYILGNPSARMSDIARALGITPSWLSIVVNSEIFKEHIYSRSKEIGDAFFLSLHEKVQGVAHLAVERLGDQVANSTDGEFLLAAADKTLGRLGMGAKGPAVNINQTNITQHNETNHVNAAIVAEAREKIFQLARQGGADDKTLPSPQGIQTGGPSGVGQDSPPPTTVYQEETTPGPESSGSEVREEGSGSLSKLLSATVSPESLD